MKTARDQLTDAYKSMKKADIVEHTLDLVDQLEGLRRAFGNAIDGMNAAAATVGSFEELVRIMKADIRTASNLFTCGKKARSARTAGADGGHA